VRYPRSGNSRAAAARDYGAASTGSTSGLDFASPSPPRAQGRSRFMIDGSKRGLPRTGRNVTSRRAAGYAGEPGDSAPKRMIKRLAARVSVRRVGCETESRPHRVKPAREPGTIRCQATTIGASFRQRGEPWNHCSSPLLLALESRCAPPRQGPGGRALERAKRRRSQRCPQQNQEQDSERAGSHDSINAGACDERQRIL
jgi:hypothetical protein